MQSLKILGVVATLCLPLAALAGDKPARLTAMEIVQKHLAARGGAKAWQGVQTMVWNGKMEIGYGDSIERSQRFVSNAAARKTRAPAKKAAAKDEARKQVQVPFTLEMKRPSRSRVEVEFAGNRSVQVYDGKSGWLLRPYLNRNDWEPFSAEQAKAQQRDKWELGGPLMDYAARGVKVELVSMEPVDGHSAYKLKLTHKTGDVQLVWIDARSFLDVKVEGAPRRLDGKLHPVYVTERDYRSVNGLMVPFEMVTVVDGAPDPHRMTIEKVAVNPKLDDGLFSRPRT